MRWGGYVAAAAVIGMMSGRAHAARPDVVVTLKPVHALVAAVMDGAGSPFLLLESASSPHAYAMKPSEARRLHEADIVVRVSESLEVFLVKPLSLASRRTRIVTLDRLAGLTLHRMRSGGDFEPDRHGTRGATDRHRNEHEHSAATIDGHLWLDPVNAGKIARHVADVLSAAAPSEAKRFHDNASALLARLEALDRRLTDEFRAVADRPYIVFHDAYQYLERRFGLANAGAVTINPEVPPSARRLSQIRARLSQKGIICVFSEPQFPPRAVDTVIEGTGVRRGTLDPLGAALKPGPSQYFELLEGLARDLKSCLAPAG